MRATNVIFCIAALCLLPVCAYASDSPDQVEPGPFAGSLADAIYAVVAFVILLLILWWKAWKPMLTALRARQEYIEKQIADSEKTHQKAEELLAEYQAKLDRAEEKGQQIIAAHTKEAQSQSANIVAQAKERIEAIKAKAKDDIQTAQDAAQMELITKAGEIVTQLGSEILGRSITDEDNQKLMDQAIQELKNQENKTRG